MVKNQINFNKIKKAKKINKSKKDFTTIYYYLAVVFIFNLLIWVTPLLTIAQNDAALAFFSFFSLFCHQIFERSLCLSSDLQLGNCDSNTSFIYQFPVCARDISFYLAMLVGGVIYLLSGKKNEVKTPPLYILIILVFPLAIDGITQLLEIRESNNFLRIITGAIAGIAIPFYLIPILNKLTLLYLLRK